MDAQELSIGFDDAVAQMDMPPGPVHGEGGVNDTVLIIGETLNDDGRQSLFIKIECSIRIGVDKSGM